MSLLACFLGQIEPLVDRPIFCFDSFLSRESWVDYHSLTELLLMGCERVPMRQTHYWGNVDALFYRMTAALCIH